MGRARVSVRVSECERECEWVSVWMSIRQQCRDLGRLDPLCTACQGASHHAGLPPFWKICGVLLGRMQHGVTRAYVCRPRVHLAPSNQQPLLWQCWPTHRSCTNEAAVPGNHSNVEAEPSPAAVPLLEPSQERRWKLHTPAAPQQDVHTSAAHQPNLRTSAALQPDLHTPATHTTTHRHELSNLHELSVLQKPQQTRGAALTAHTSP